MSQAAPNPSLPPSLAGLRERLTAPFPAALIHWKPQIFSPDRARVMLVPYLDARAVQARLDELCADDWQFAVQAIPGNMRALKGRLTLMGVAREDIGEAPEGSADTLKAASSDALKRCALQFGIGRYLHDVPGCWADWNEDQRRPLTRPELPDWARPDAERTPAGRHLVQALGELRDQLPLDLALQREVYKHLKDALHAVRQHRGGSQNAEP